jgi:hypothetical protein
MVLFIQQLYNLTMRQKIKLSALIFILFSLVNNTFGQKGYPITSIVSELVNSEGLQKLPPKSKSILSGKTGEFDIDERFYYQIRNEFVEKPEMVLPLSCFIKKIEYIIRFGENVYGPFYIEGNNIPQGNDPSRFSTTPRNLLNPVKSEVLDKLNSRNINNLQIIFKGIWYTKDELHKEKKQCIELNQIDKESRIDVFTLTIKKFGLIVLFDLSPLSKEGSQLTLDVVSGLVKNLSKTSIDYVSVLNKPTFSNVMVSVPFLKYEGREWFYKNFELETVMVMDLADKNKLTGFGFGVGALGVKDKTLKAGIFWQENKPNYYVGVSVRGLANWLSNYK